MRRKTNDQGAKRAFCALVVVVVVVVGVMFFCPLAYVTLRRPGASDASSKALHGRGGGRVDQEEVERDDEDCCRGVVHLELWGPAVKWGSDLILNSSRECCRACKDMCPDGGGTCRCNSWVFCGDRERCGKKFGECWLKKQDDVLSPDLHESGETVMWTSGLVSGNREGIVGLRTEFGIIRIKLFPDLAPKSVLYIAELLKLRLCTGCQIYRAEGRGHAWDLQGNHIADSFFGPPYGLIQGKLEAEGIDFLELPAEARPLIKRGSVAWIGSGPEFFISLADHAEWLRSYRVFGSVLPEDMEIADKIASLPTKSDVWNGIHVLLLEKPIDLKLERITTLSNLRIPRDSGS